MAREYCALRCLPKGLARISSFGKLSHQFSAIEQFEQIGESVVSRGAFAGKMAGEDGLRLKDRLDQYGVVVHLALVPLKGGRRCFIPAASLSLPKTLSMTRGQGRIRT
jgi:hypothetical protein